MEYFHPMPLPRQALVLVRSSVLKRKIGYELSLSSSVLSCRKTAGGHGHDWSVDVVDSVVGTGSRRNEISVKKERWHYRFEIEDDVDFKAWFEAIKYAAKWRVESFYIMGDIIGEGGFGKVYRCRAKDTNVNYACKVVDMEEMSASERKMVRNEVEIMSQLNHERFVQVFDVFERDSKVYIVMELITGGDLFSLLEREKKVSEAHAHRIIKQIIQGLVHLHGKGFMHRDLKPENVMISGTLEDPAIKIIDLGLADAIVSGDKGAVHFKGTGTTGYMAPEIIVGEAHDASVDMWACGCILFMLLSGTMPFTQKGRHCRSSSKISLKSVSAEYTFVEEDWLGVSKAAKSFVQTLIQLQSFKRLSARAALEHVWFSGGTMIPIQEPRNSSAKFRRCVRALMFIASFKLEIRGKLRQSYISLRRAPSAHTTLGITNIYAHNTSSAD